MAREQFTLEILADIQNAVTPIQKMVQLLRVFDEGSVIDVIAAPGVDTAIKKIDELSVRAAGAGENSKKLATEFRTATSQLKFGTVGTDQARALSQELKSNTERFREFRNVVKTGSQNVLDPNLITGFQTFSDGITQIDNRIRGMNANITKFGFTEKTLQQSREINVLIERLAGQFPAVRAAVEQQLVKPFQDGRVAVQDVGRFIERLKSTDAFTALASEAKNLERSIKGVQKVASQIDSQGGVIDEKSENNFIRTDAKAKRLQNTLEALRGARAGMNVSIMDPAEVSAIDNLIGQLENRLGSVNTLLDRNRDSASRSKDAHRGILVAAELIKKTEQDLLQARMANSDALRQQNTEYLKIGAAKDRIEKISKTRDLTAAESQELARLRQRYLEVRDEILKLRDVQETLDKTNVFTNLIDRLNGLKSSMVDGKKVTAEFREQFKTLTGIEFKNKNAREYQESLAKLNQIIKELSKEFPKAASAANKLAKANVANGDTFRRMKSEVKDFNFFMTIAIEKIIRYRIAFTALQNSVRAIQSTFTIAKDIESSFAQIAKVTLGTAISIDQLKQSSFDLGRTFGKSIKDITDIMFIWAQQGKSQNDILALTRSTMAGMVGANLDASTAVETLTSAQRIYNLTAEQSLTVFDKLLNVQRQFAVTTKDLADSIKLLGITASEFGINMDNLLAQVTAVVQVTRKSGQQVANSLKTIFAKFIQTDSVKALRDIGVAVFDVNDSVRPLDQTLGELSEKWDTLSSSQRLNIARLLGGIRHYTQFLVLMDQYPVVLDAATKSQQSAGFALKASNIELETLANQLGRVQAVFTEFGNAIGTATAGLANQVGGIAELFENISNAIKGLGDNTGISALKELTAGVLLFGEALFVVGASRFLYNAGVSKFGEQLVSSVLPGIIIVDSNVQKLSGHLAEHGVIAADAGLQMAGATETETQAVARLGRTLSGTETRVVSFGTKQYTIANGANVARIGIDAQNRSLALNNKQLSAAGATAITTSKAYSKFGSSVAGATGFLGGPGGAVFSVAITLLAGLALNARKAGDSFNYLNDAVKQNVKDLFGLTENYEQLARKSFDATLNAQKYFDILNNEQSTIEDQAKALDGLRLILGGVGSLSNKLKGLELSTNTDALENEVVIREELTKLLQLYGNALTDSNRQALQVYSSQRDELQRYGDELRGLADEQSALSKAAEDSRALIGGIEIALAKKYKNELADINTKIINQTAVIKRLKEQNIYEDTNSQRRIEEQTLRNLEAKKANLDNNFLNQIKEETRALVILESATKDFINSAIATQDPVLTTALFGDKDPVKETEKLTDQIAKAMFDRFQRTGEFNFTNIFADVEGIRVAEAATSALTGELSKTDLQTQEIKKSMQEFQDAATGALAFTAEELQKMNERLEKFAAKAQISFESLEKSINEAVSAASAKNVKTTFFDIAIKENEKALSAITETTRALEEQKRAAELSAQIQKIIAEEELEANKLAFEAAKIQENTARGRLADLIRTSGLTESQLKQNEEYADSYNRIRFGIDRATESVAVLARAVHNAEPDTRKYDELVDKLQQSVDAGDLSAEAAGLIERVYKRIPQTIDNRIERLDRELKLAEELTDTQKEAIEGDLARYRTQKLILDAEKERSRLVAENAQKDVGVVNTVLQQLERSTGATAKIIALQNNEYQTQLKLAEAVAQAAALATDEHFDHGQLIRDIITGQYEWKEIVDRITAAYGDQTATANEQLTSLQAQKEIIDINAKLTDNRLKAELAISRAIETYNRNIDRTNSLTDYLVSARNTLGSLIGDNADALDNEIHALELSKVAYRDINDAVKQTLDTTAKLGATQSQVVEGLRDNVDLLNDDFETTLEILDKKFEKALIKLKPLLVDMQQLSSSIAGSFVNAFSGINESLVTRFESIADKQDEISERSSDINFLNEKLAAITDKNSEEFARVKDEILEAEIELRNMNKELEDMSNAGKILKSVFGDFASTLGELVVDIQTDSLKRALENSLTNTGIGNTIRDAFLTGSQLAAKELVQQSQQQFAAIQNINNRILETSGQILSNQLVAGIVTGGDQAALAMDRTFQSFIRNWATINKIDVPEALLESNEEPLTPADMEALGDTLTRNADILNDQLKSDRDLAIKETKKLNENVGKQLEENKEFNAGLVLLRASIPLIAKDLGTLLSAKVFGADSAGAASTGANFGSLAGSILSATDKDGKNLFGSLFGSSAGSFAGSTLGSLLLPGLGSIAGSLLGGLIGGRDDPLEEIRAPLTDLSQETKANTEAIRQLNSTFDDLRSELINAPSRFVLPSQATLGGRVDGGGASGIGSPVGDAAGTGGGGSGLTVQFNVNGGFDQGAANQAVQQIADLYDKQRRSGGGGRILRR